MVKRKHVVDSDSEEEFKATKFVDVEASEDEPSEDESMNSFINELAEDVEAAEEEEEEPEEQAEYAEESGEEEDLHDFEEYTKTVEERYKVVDAMEVEEIPQQLLLPTDKSPKLWLIRCTPAKEKQIVLSIIRKAILNKLNITAALTNELVKGYIYVEAYQKQQVLQAIDGIFGAFKTNITQIPNKEMADVLYIPELDPVIYKEGNYLRVVKGVHSGEIAKIDSLGTGKDKIMVMLVPKINHKHKLFNPNDFNKSEIYKMSKSTWVYKKEMYKDGHLLKGLPISYLAATPAVTKEEKKWFDTAENKKTAGVLFVKDEVVEIVYGGLKGAIGKVLSVGEEDALIKIGDKKITVSLSEIRKKYAIGDEVLVVSGRKRGKCGFIVGIEGNKLMIGINNFTDEIEAEIEEVKLSSVPDAPKETEKAPGKIATRTKRDPLVDRQGEITAGEYKGKRGTIKDVLPNAYRIQLITSLKCISVKKSDFEIHKRNSAPQMRETDQFEKEEMLNSIAQDKNRTYSDDEDSSTTPVQDEGTPLIESEVYTPTKPINSYSFSDDE
ncbi:transcription elongation factor SPT5 [Nematocida sp. AWRm78]|nr:transcription elongation factor SPT5 [Nematocida sp. AWRm79]KAI5183101.1 transcription elongation factor SPT5 [Nematocida sp. AWRm78]